MGNFLWRHKIEWANIFMVSALNWLKRPPADMHCHEVAITCGPQDQLYENIQVLVFVAGCSCGRGLAGQLWWLVLTTTDNWSTNRWYMIYKNLNNKNKSPFMFFTTFQIITAKYTFRAWTWSWTMYLVLLVLYPIVIAAMPASASVQVSWIFTCPNKKIYQPFF